MSTGHPRLYRRGARYYHRAAIPQDIQGSYPKAEETFSLSTSDYQEALRLVRTAAVEVDRKFDKHRRWVSAQAKPLDYLSDEQIERLASLYHASILDEDEDIRTDGIFEKEPGEPGTDWERWDFDEYAEEVDDSLASTRRSYARGQQDALMAGARLSRTLKHSVRASVSPCQKSSMLMLALKSTSVTTGRRPLAKSLRKPSERSLS